MTWQPAPILFPDAELVLTGAFRGALAAHAAADVYVSRSVPSTRRPRMLILNRDGGASTGVRDRPRIRVRVWDETDQKATDLARLVLALAPSLSAWDARILRAEILSGPYEVAEESGQALRYALLEFHLRGEAL